MNKSLSTTLIISTYNWPEALELCLLSVLNQVILPDEIIIADDGSDDRTKILLEGYKPQFNIPLIHVWQPDEGFQLSKIRNKAIAKASMEYIIQIDGDLILHKRFISDHVSFAKGGSFATGSRVILEETLSKQLISERRINVSVLSKGLSNISNGFRSGLMRKYLSTRYRVNDMYYMRGCNMAFWRNDLLQVNGYNEDFVGWGREDNEIAVRLINSGIRKRVLKFGAVVFHIHHKVSSKSNLNCNDEMLRSAIKHKTVRITKGLDQYL